MEQSAFERAQKLFDEAETKEGGIEGRLNDLQTWQLCQHVWDRLCHDMRMYGWLGWSDKWKETILREEGKWTVILAKQQRQHTLHKKTRLFHFYVLDYRNLYRSDLICPPNRLNIPNPFPHIESPSFANFPTRNEPSTAFRGGTALKKIYNEVEGFARSTVKMRKLLSVQIISLQNIANPWMRIEN